MHFIILLTILLGVSFFLFLFLEEHSIIFKLGLSPYHYWAWLPKTKVKIARALGRPLQIEWVSPREKNQPPPMQRQTTQPRHHRRNAVQFPKGERALDPCIRLRFIASSSNKFHKLRLRFGWYCHRLWFIQYVPIFKNSYVIIQQP